MDRPYQHISIDRHGGVFAVRLVQQRFSDEELDRLGSELARLLDVEGCRNIVLSLGPDEPDCLYSLFLAKLVSLKRRLEQAGGTLALTNMSPHTHEIFQVSGVEKFFPTFPDAESALRSLSGS